MTLSEVPSVAWIKRKEDRISVLERQWVGVCFPATRQINCSVGLSRADEESDFGLANHYIRQPHG